MSFLPKFVMLDFLTMCKNLSLGYLKFCVLLLRFNKFIFTELLFWPKKLIKFKNPQIQIFETLVCKFKFCKHTLNKGFRILQISMAKSGKSEK